MSELGRPPVSFRCSSRLRYDMMSNINIWYDYGLETRAPIGLDYGTNRANASAMNIDAIAYQLG